MTIYGFNADEIFQVAIDIEKNGKRFYEKATTLVKDPDFKSLLEFLAKEEDNHIKTFTELKAQLPEAATKDTVWDPFDEMNQYLQMMAGMNVFRSDLDVDGKLSDIKEPEDIIKLGIQFEKDSVVFYTTIQDATEEKKGREFIGRLVDEEKKHLKKLCQALGKHAAACET
jgi:rubrerythrin